jgi:hypothetical protein
VQVGTAGGASQGAGAATTPLTPGGIVIGAIVGLASNTYGECRRVACGLRPLAQSLTWDSDVLLVLVLLPHAARPGHLLRARGAQSLPRVRGCLAPINHQLAYI